MPSSGCDRAIAVMKTQQWTRCEYTLRVKAEEDRIRIREIWGRRKLARVGE